MSEEICDLTPTAKKNLDHAIARKLGYRTEKVAGLEIYEFYSPTGQWLGNRNVEAHVWEDLAPHFTSDLHSAMTLLTPPYRIEARTNTRFTVTIEDGPKTYRATTSSLASAIAMCWDIWSDHQEAEIE